MVAWGVTDAGGGNTGVPLDYVVRADDWTGGVGGATLLATTAGVQHSETTSRRSGERVTGRTDSLWLPGTAARVDDTGLAVGGRRSVSSSAHRLVVTDGSGSATARASVRFRGPARLERTSEAVRVEFPDPSTVTISVTGPDPDPPTVTVPDTPSGLAAGLTAAGAAHETDAPDRSRRARRRHPPLFERGESLSIPSSVGDRIDDGGVELTVPEAYGPLFVAAPLSFYLDAMLRTGDVDRPVLRVPEAGLVHRFGEPPGFQRECADLLQRVFHLDRLVCGTDGAVPPLLADLGLDPDALATAPTGVRTARYLEASGPTLTDRLPEWHLSTYAEPSPSRVSALPYLLDDLSLIYRPAGSQLDDAELLDRTLSAAYRGPAADAPSVDVLDPDLRDGRVHAWLAPGTPIDAFKTTPEAYRNRRRYRRRSDPFSVTVVLNDESMADEHSRVAAIYRERAGGLPIDLDVREALTTDELAAAFAAPNDFLHYIGHCETGGLRCVDGALSVADLDRSHTRAFFLNACGSYHEGLDLVDRGSLAGAVTLTSVLNEQAAKVGTAFARLLVHGFAIERAMQLARRRILMGKDYAVVGDGTDSLVPTPEEPTVVRLSDAADGYRLSCERPPCAGRRVQPPSPDRGPVERTLSGDDLRSLFSGTDLPVIYQGRLHWSSDLADAV